jgi:hypothetical protein
MSIPIFTSKASAMFVIEVAGKTYTYQSTSGLSPARLVALAASCSVVSTDDGRNDEG